MMFHFTLRPLTQITPWGEPGNESLHWFGITDGLYWIAAGDQELLRYSDEICATKGWERHCEYQVARFHEDLIEMLPHILEPIPESLSHYIQGDSGKAWQALLSTWLDHSQVSMMDDDQEFLTWDAAATWISRRTLDTAYLSPSANIRLWSDVDNIYISWDNSETTIDGIPAWSAVKGKYQMPRDIFLDEIKSFHASLMFEMDERVNQVIKGGMPSHIQVNHAQLLQDQAQHQKALAIVLSEPQNQTDWALVNNSISKIEYEMRERYV